MLAPYLRFIPIFIIAETLWLWHPTAIRTGQHTQSIHLTVVSIYFSSRRLTALSRKLATLILEMCFVSK